MEQAPTLFALAFFFAFAMYLFFGIYIIYRNYQENLNKIFFVIAIALCFWSLGFAGAVAATNIETALLWRRFSAIGWGSIYALLLHFFILLTDFQPLLERRKLLPLLYLPAVFSVFAFSLSKTMATFQYNLVKIEFGWINVAAQNAWDGFFQVYYISYLVACMLLLFYWRHSTSNKLIKKQANLILITLFTALVLGTLTDIIWSSRLATPLPQMAPVFILIPIAAIFYLIRKYNLMGDASSNNEELILNDETRIKLYYYLATAFLTGGIITALSYFLPHMLYNEDILILMLYAGGILFLFGIVILLFQFSKKKRTKDYLAVAAMATAIPVITLIFVRYAGITVWAIPFILIIVSLIFNSRTPLFIITAVAIITQLLVWIYTPIEAVKVDEFDHILRIGMFVIAFGIGTFVNETYIKRLRENTFQINMQKMISDISSIFVSLELTNIDEKINSMLNKMGHFFKADRTFIYMFDQQNNMVYTHEWHGEKVYPKIGKIPTISINELPWLEHEFTQDKLVYIEDVYKLPPEANKEKEWLIAENIKTVLLVPIYGREGLIGFIGLYSEKSYSNYGDNHFKLLKILANILADGLMKNKAETEVQYMAYYDQLTGLPNHTLFIDRLTQAIHLAKRNEKFIGVFFMDLDSFKTVNDTMGHSAGDIIIQEVARGLTDCLRKTDTVARFGGDEFLIMVNNIEDSRDITIIANNIMTLFEKPLEVNGQELFITCSTGIAVYPYDGEEAGSLIKNADIALYKAKSRGKNQYVLCTEDMKDEVKKNMVLSNNLYRAIERNELMLYYQPQINLSSGHITGLEALLRWQHPEMGIISPGIFIPLAESNGLINSIGEWVLKTAVNQNKKWQDMGLPHLRMAVNLSIMQFNNSRIVDNVEQILDETGLSPEYLELEITESIAMKETNHIIAVLNKFKELGVTISIDDFGTEYSSLNRLKMLPIDRIKIDMQFVQGIEDSEKDQAITKIIINLGKSLGLEVLAEGVETESQLDFLNEKMCDDVQGYLFYKPMPAAEIEKILWADN